MSEELNDSAIEIRSEEINDILGKTPVWILRRGIVLLSLIIVALLTGSWLFKYPDVIAAPIIITSQNPPFPLTARTSGKIMAIFVKDQQQIKSGQYLAVLENAADLQSVLQLKALILKGDIESSSSAALPITNLGDLQQLYTVWVTSVSDYKRYVEHDYDGKNVKLIDEQIRLTRGNNEIPGSQNVLQTRDLKNSGKQYLHDSMLLLQKGNLSVDPKISETNLLSDKTTASKSGIGLSSTTMQLTQLEQQILQIRIKEEEDKKRMLDAINANTQALRNQLQTWEMTYTLKSPVSGKVVLANYWSANQQVKAGDQLMTIIPDGVSIPVGKITLAMQGSGKVKTGQKVNIKLTKYPYLEYGMIRGIVSRLSEVPYQNNYTVEVTLPSGLKTNYKKQLHFDPEMTGTAEIITEDMSLLERTLSPLRSLINQ